MAQAIKEAWAVAPTSTTSLTVTGLSTLASGSSATSNTIDNYNAGANQFSECVVTVSLTTGGSGTSTSGYCEIYVQASLDNSNFPDVTNDELLGVMSLTANSTTYKKTFAVSWAFQGTLPPYFKLRFNNQCGSAFTAATVVYNQAYFTIA